MKKLTFAAITILALSSAASNLQAREASTEENVGFFTGAIAGAAVGGPIGFIIGGVSGVVLGDQVSQANQVEGLEMKLSQQNQMNSGLMDELDTLQVSLEQTYNLLESKTNFLTHELTLNLMFQSNSSELADKDMALVNRISSILTDFPELNIQLDGYADPVGNSEDNLNLSQNRTSNVKDAFKAMGISSNRILENAHGESLSTFDVEGSDSYALERRVSINFYIDENSESLSSSDTQSNELKSAETSEVLAIN